MNLIAIRIANNEYCKPTFIRMREISAKFVKALSQIFLVANQSMSYSCYNNSEVGREN